MSPRGVHCWHVELTSWIAACAFLSCFTLRFVTVSPFTINADRTRSQNLHGNLSARIMDALLSGQRSCSCEPGAGMLNTLNIFSSVDSVDLKNVCYDLWSRWAWKAVSACRILLFYTLFWRSIIMLQQCCLFLMDGITFLARHRKGTGCVKYKVPSTALQI